MHNHLNQLVGKGVSQNITWEISRAKRGMQLENELCFTIVTSTAMLGQH